ncbi:MAG: protein kinase [bacterium]|nr:protein kinase [bacterium]
MKNLPEIPGFKIEKTLGQGGMATVLLGVQETLNREVAIKILVPDMFMDEQYLSRFLNEAHTASRLSHPNIVTIHDVGQVDDYCYIVMERLQESLVERVKFTATNKLHPTEAFKIIAQIADALDYAHSEGFIHRDIKPDNILFRRDGTPVLVDFGIARAMDARTRLTGTGMILGTPHYMSPEQCKGEKIDGQSDFYGLGIVLFEILTGDVPYKSDSAAGVLFKHVQDPVPQLPQELAKYQPVITRMTAKDRHSRVQNGTEVKRLMETHGPDTRIDTVKGMQADQWVMDGSDKAPSEDLTVQSPLPSHTAPIQHKSRGPLIVTLLSIPFIIAAIYFLFLHNTGENEPVKEPTQQHDTANTSTPPSTAGSTPTSDTTNTAAGTATGPPPAKDDPVKKDAATEPAATGDNGEKDPAASHGEEYDTHLFWVKEYLTNNDYEKALEKLNQAEAIKNTPEVAELKKQVEQKLTESTQLKEQEYTKHFTLAKKYFNEKKYKKAISSIQEARKHKSTGDLDSIEKRILGIEKKNAEAARKKRIAEARVKKRRQADDAAYKRAVSRNTIYAYEKYLEKYPKGIHAAEARKKFDENKQVALLEERIKDDTAYELVTKENTVSGYYNYLEKYPKGRHVAETQAKIKTLKEKIAGDTKIKLDIQHIRFFESSLDVPAMDARTYENRFAAAGTRYVYCELSYKNKLYRIAESSSKLRVVYKGAFTLELTGTIVQEEGSRTGVFWRGMGWPQAGKWPKGPYIVTVFLDNEKISESSFEVY